MAAIGLGAADEAPAVVLRWMINSCQITQMIYVAARLGIADLVAESPKTSVELAASTGAHALSLYRLLRGLASLGIFAEDAQGRFGLTPLAEPLRTGVAGSLHGDALWNGEPSNWLSWGDLLYCVQTGEDAGRHLFGLRSWEYRAQHPELNLLLNDVMTEVSQIENAAIVAAYDFSGLETLVDIGGGQGSLLSAILAANPALRGVLFDQPHVVTGAPPVLQAAGVASRCEIVAGDMFAALPDGADAYLLKHIVHDWEDDHAVAILKNCRQVVKPGGRVLVVEYAIPPGNQPDVGKMIDIIMLVSEGGRERTEAEFRLLFQQAGLAVTRIIPTQAGVSVIEAMPV